jgi:predicted RNase H-like HicB family nuclease
MAHDAMRSLAVQFAVVLRPQPNGSLQAIVPAVPGVIAYGSNREEALDAARCAIKEALAAGEIVTIDVPLDGEPVRNPWLETAGMFADDETWDDFIAEMRAARARGCPPA